MKVLGFDGREHNFVPSNKQANVASRSKLHEKAYELIREIYPFANILQEVTLPGSYTMLNGTLRADFFLPVKRVVVEVHGEQHDKFNAHFYDSEKDFKKAKARDKKKREWCEMNNIEYIDLRWDEDEEQWRGKL